MSNDDRDNASAMTGPSHRLTGPSNRGLGGVRNAQSPPSSPTAQSSSAHPMDARYWASKESLGSLAALQDPASWPLSAPDFHAQVIANRHGRLKLMHTKRARLRQTPLGVQGSWNPIPANSVMAPKKAYAFIERFILPLLKHELGRTHLASVVNGRHPVAALWATDKQTFGLTGAVMTDPRGARNPKTGSPSLIFIDEQGNDWRQVPDLTTMPDIGFFHELTHAEFSQRGMNDASTEREVRIEENRYRHQRGASSQRVLP